MLLITGADGQLGTALAQVLPAALRAGRAALDITDGSAVRDYVRMHGVTAIINCAAYTAVDKAEDDSAQAFAVNAAAVRNLASCHVPLVHVSTDYVFDGQSPRPYREDDVLRPTSAYGESKAAGEAYALENPQGGVVVRTSWLYARQGANFLTTMLRLGAERPEVKVVADQVGTPTYAPDLARALAVIVAQAGQKRGIYHFSNEGVCSWYDFAHEIMKRRHSQCRVKAISSAEYPSKVRRPSYSVLDKAKIKADFGIDIRHWRDALDECLTVTVTA